MVFDDARRAIQQALSIARSELGCGASCACGAGGDSISTIAHPFPSQVQKNSHQVVGCDQCGAARCECGLPVHFPLNCWQAAGAVSRFSSQLDLDAELILTPAMKIMRQRAQHTRACPSCDYPIHNAGERFKYQRCIRCGYEFCWFCRSPFNTDSEQQIAAHDECRGKTDCTDLPAGLDFEGPTVFVRSSSSLGGSSSSSAASLERERSRSESDLTPFSSIHRRLRNSALSLWTQMHLKPAKQQKPPPARRSLLSALMNLSMPTLRPSSSLPATSTSCSNLSTVEDSGDVRDASPFPRRATEIDVAGILFLRIHERIVTVLAPGFPATLHTLGGPEDAFLVEAKRAVHLAYGLALWGAYANPRKFGLDTVELTRATARLFESIVSGANPSCDQPSGSSAASSPGFKTPGKLPGAGSSDGVAMWTLLRSVQEMTANLADAMHASSTNPDPLEDREEPCRGSHRPSAAQSLTNLCGDGGARKGSLTGIRASLRARSRSSSSMSIDKPATAASGVPGAVREKGVGTATTLRQKLVMRSSLFS